MVKTSWICNVAFYSATKTPLLYLLSMVGAIIS